MRVVWLAPDALVESAWRDSGQETDFSEDVGAEMVARGYARKVEPIKVESPVAMAKPAVEKPGTEE
jgi:hypothetical protein